MSSQSDRLSSAFRSLHSDKKLDSTQLDQLQQISTAEENELISTLDQTNWQDALAEKALAILASSASSSSSSFTSSTIEPISEDGSAPTGPRIKKLASSGGSNAGKKKPMALNITVVQAANASEVAVEQDEEETQNGQLLKQKRLNPGKRRTMPVEKAGIPTDKLNAEAKQAQ